MSYPASAKLYTVATIMQRRAENALTLDTCAAELLGEGETRRVEPSRPPAPQRYHGTAHTTSAL